MWDDGPCAPGHNAPLPLERSPPASFKRLLGGKGTALRVRQSPNRSERPPPEETKTRQRNADREVQPRHVLRSSKGPAFEELVQEGELRQVRSKKCKRG